MSRQIFKTKKNDQLKQTKYVIVEYQLIDFQIIK